MVVLAVVFLFFLSINSEFVIGETEISESWGAEDFAIFPSVPLAAPNSKDEKCRQDSRTFITHLKNKTYWAMQMWDASSKTDYGVLYGNVYQGGNFDECLLIQEPIEAKYCVISIRAIVNATDPGEEPYNIDPNPYASVWQKLVNSRYDKSKIPRDNTTRAICVPASCSVQDLMKHTNEYLKNRTSKWQNEVTRFQINIKDEHCQWRQQNLDHIIIPGTVAFWIALGIIVFVVLTATSLQSYQAITRTKIRKTKAIRLLYSFSLLANWIRLRKPDETGSEKLRILYICKYATIMFIVYAHRTVIYMSTPVVNFQTFEATGRTIHNLFLPHTDLLVDTFFFISGLLVAFLLLQLYSRKFVNPLFIIFGRLIRLVPLYYFVIWFQASGFYSLGSGPVWVGMKPEVLNCQKNWWTNVLFINNYVNVDESCLIHAWFMPCEFHFFLMAIIIVITISKNEKLGVGLLGIATAVSLAIPGIITYMHKLIPIMLFYHENLGSDIRRGATWQYLYIPSHARACVYFIGMTAGYVIFKYEKHNRIIPHKWSVIGLLVVPAMLFAPMAYGGLYYDPSRPYNVIESAIFASLRRVFWGLACFLFMMISSFGNLALIKYVANMKFFFPLAKVTYAIYLIHFYMIMGERSSIRVQGYFSFYSMFLQGCGDLLSSTIFATIVYLTIELPFKAFFHELLFAGVINRVKNEIEQNQQNNLGEESKNAVEVPNSIVTKM